jgi:hypothetical protein
MSWADPWKLGASMWANGVALSETMLAANNVVRYRGKTIDAAMRDPMHADVAELGRMVPEKIAAFGKAGTALAQDWAVMQREMLAQSSDMLRLSTSWPPDTAIAARMLERSTRLALQMSMASGRALAPVHAAATSNDRRLGK